MSCDAVALAATFWLISTAAIAAPTPGAPVQGQPPPSVASEPLFANIVSRATKLRDETKAYEQNSLNVGIDRMPGFSTFQGDVGQLASLDMKGHVVLTQRGVSDDLKCILKGISQDLPVKLKELQTASDPKTRKQALDDMFYLLRDNVDVITAPPQPSA